ncbi:hypothetical protein DVH24_019799 [Malus domestica]|uniref:Uncharacterized protein n=1 Tax=Malus domestica TaxID=3750 RepID=A0A498I5Z6_MALDO|nr:hypothetical protein DVH24_019799 [Malus domestica]
MKKNGRDILGNRIILGVNAKHIRNCFDPPQVERTFAFIWLFETLSYLRSENYAKVCKEKPQLLPKICHWDTYLNSSHHKLKSGLFAKKKVVVHPITQT